MSNLVRSWRSRWISQNYWRSGWRGRFACWLQNKNAAQQEKEE